jgi:hypothetical protein
MDTYGPKDALTLLLTAEGLIFAALGIGVAAAHRRIGQGFGWLPFIVSLLAVGVVALIAVGASSAWSNIYDASAGAPEATKLEVQGIALIVAIIAQPVLALAYVVWIYLRSR